MEEMASQEGFRILEVVKENRKRGKSP